MLALLGRAAFCAEMHGEAGVTPAEDLEALLHNPDTGWVLYENYPVDPRPGGSSTLDSLPDDDFAVVGEVAVRFSWADVEQFVKVGCVGLVFS